jgi:hypothetical protein
MIKETLDALIKRNKEELARLPPDPLPEWKEGWSAIMNALIRSATFKPIEKGTREVIIENEIASQAGYKITFSGPELDENDRDVYLEATRLYSGIVPGSIYKTSIRNFLKGINRTATGENATRLKDSLIRIAQTNVTIIFDTIKYQGRYAGGILNVLILDGKESTCEDSISFAMPPALLRHFHKDFTKIPMDKRLLLKGQASQLAKWLHGYIYSHKTPYPITISKFKELCGSKTSNINSFKYQLKKSLELLKQNGDIINWKIEQDIVYIFRTKESENQRFLEF